MKPPDYSTSMLATRRRCPRNRYSAPAVAALKAGRRVKLRFILLLTLGPLAIAGVLKLIEHYHSR